MNIKKLNVDSIKWLREGRGAEHPWVPQPPEPHYLQNGLLANQNRLHAALCYVYKALKLCIHVQESDIQ